MSIGGKGAIGGDAGRVAIANAAGAQITTRGDRAYGIYAESLGGGGGTGGFAVSSGVGVSLFV